MQLTRQHINDLLVKDPTSFTEIGWNHALNTVGLLLDITPPEVVKCEHCMSTGFLDRSYPQKKETR